MNLRKTTIFLCVGLCASAASAEEYIQYSSPAAGSDAITNLMAKEGFFLAHEDNCITGQEFIQIWDNEDGTDIGFCIEESERTASEWNDARATCLGLNMRLPEPSEFKFACDNGTAVSDITDDWEWASNFASPLATDSTTPQSGTVVPIGGNGSCDYGSVDWATSDTGSIGSRPFRCVR